VNASELAKQVRHAVERLDDAGLHKMLGAPAGEYSVEALVVARAELEERNRWADVGARRSQADQQMNLAAHQGAVREQLEVALLRFGQEGTLREKLGTGKYLALSTGVIGVSAVPCGWFAWILFHGWANAGMVFPWTGPPGALAFLTLFPLSSAFGVLFFQWVAHAKRALTAGAKSSVVVVLSCAVWALFMMGADKGAAVLAAPVGLIVALPGVIFAWPAASFLWRKASAHVGRAAEQSDAAGGATARVQRRC
jgi:hypothetical protein